MGFSGTPKDMGPPYGKRDPYYSHTIPISLGVPGITLDTLLYSWCDASPGFKDKAV